MPAGHDGRGFETRIVQKSSFDVAGIRRACAPTARRVLMQLFQTAENPPTVWRHIAFALGCRGARGATARVISRIFFSREQSPLLSGGIVLLCSDGGKRFSALPNVKFRIARIGARYFITNRGRRCQKYAENNLLRARITRGFLRGKTP